VRHPLLSLVAVFALSLCAFARQGDDVLKLNGKVQQACFDAKWDEALGLLGELDKLRPETSGTAYNYACVYSRKGEPDKALEWLDKAVQWGWGGGKGGIAVAGATTAPMIWHSEMLEQDKDLEPLRKDARFAKILERAKVLQKRVQDYIAAPALYVPEKLKDAPDLPVLFVLHAAGGDKQTTLAAWKGLADELGVVLAVPAAPVLLREDEKRGWGWIDDRNAFALANRVADYQRPLLAALDALRKQKPLSATRVWIAGEGEGATLALLCGLHNSLVLKGAALLDPEVVASVMGYKAQIAKSNGLRLEVRFDPAYWKAHPGALQPKESIGLWALAGSTSEVADLKDAAARQAALAAAVRTLAKSADAPVKTTPADAPK